MNAILKLLTKLKIISSKWVILILCLLNSKLYKGLPQTVSELVSDWRHTQDDVKISFDVLKENSVQVGK